MTQHQSQLSATLMLQQQTGNYVDLVLRFSCGLACVVHKCVMAATSRQVLNTELAVTEYMY